MNHQNIKKLSSDFLYSFLGTVFSKGLVFLLSIVIARILSKQVFGEYGVIRNTIILFSVFAGASLGLTGTKFISEYFRGDVQKERVESVLGSSRIAVSCLALILSLILLVFSSYLSNNFFHNDRLAIPFMFGSVAIFFSAINSLQTGILLGFQDFKGIAVANAISGIVTIPLTIILTLKYSLIGASVSLVFNSLALVLASFIILRRNYVKHNIFPRSSFRKEDIEVFRLFSLPAFLVGIVNLPANWISDAILSGSDHGFEKLGIYNAVISCTFITIALNKIVGDVLLPFTLRFFKKANSRVEFITFLLPWLISIFFNMPLMLFPNIIAGIFGTSYSGFEFNMTLTLLCVCNIVIAQREGLARSFIAANIMWFSFFSNMLWMITMIITMYFMKEFGAVGRAYSIIIAYTINTVIFIPYYLKKGLCNKKLFISFESIVIWLLVIINACIFMYLTSYVIKILWALISMTLILFMFWRLIKNEK